MSCVVVSFGSSSRSVSVLPSLCRRQFTPKSVLLFEVRLKMSNAYTYNEYKKGSGHFDNCLVVFPMTGDVTGFGSQLCLHSNQSRTEHTAVKHLCMDNVPLSCDLRCHNHVVQKKYKQPQKATKSRCFKSVELFKITKAKKQNIQQHRLYLLIC